VSDINEYRKYVEKLALAESSEFFDNSSDEHAKVVLACMFKYAKKSISIYCRAMLDRIYGTSEVIDEVSGFIERGGAVRILIEGSESDVPTELLEHGAFIQSLSSRLTKDKHKYLEFQRAEDVIRNLNSNHFLVMDSKGLRYELNHDTREASAVFNKSDLAESYQRLFNKLWTHSHPISLRFESTLQK
jgi:hypothetical protein